MKPDKATIDMMIKCGCEKCEDKDKCNIGVDLVNCYATKRLKVKSGRDRKT